MQFWNFLKRQQPDLLLLAIFLDPTMTDLRLAQQLKQTYPDLRIVLLTSASSNVRLIQEANQLEMAPVDVNEKLTRFCVLKF